MVDDPDFVVEMSYAEGAVLRMFGSADTGATGPLATLLDQLHVELLQRRTRVVVVDLHEVEVMVAACFKELLAWVGKLQETAPAERYKIRFRTNSAIPWQQHSLAALTCFDTESLTILPDEAARREG